uniref:Uncharacterized protein n=1 Tax=Caenorhabditis japonica TaxID=281687 RepID=A0A8R1IQC2_CAEJA
MPARSLVSNVPTSRVVTTPFVSTNQGHYLTVPSTLEIARTTQRHVREPPWMENENNTLFRKLWIYLVLVFLLCVITALGYTFMLTRYDEEPKINNESLLAALVDARKMRLNKKENQTLF